MQSVFWSSSASSAQYKTDDVLRPFAPQVVCTTKVELTLSCKNLLNRDLASKSDPYCILSMKERGQDDLSWKQIGRTETIENCLDPQWAKKFIVNYNFETIQDMRFDIRDDDSGGKCGKFDTLGSFDTILSTIVSFSGKQFVGKLMCPLAKECGEIILVAEEVAICKKLLEVEFKTEKLKKQSWYRYNDPFLVISRSNEDGSYSVVKRPGTIESSGTPFWMLTLSKPSPTWKMSIRLTSLCNGDYDRNIKIDCYDRRRNGNHKLIGSCVTTLRTIEIETLKLYKYKGKKCDVSGIIKMQKFQILNEVTFMDYIRHGTQMHFAVAVDFTQSNVEYTKPESLHHLKADALNPYQIALQSVGEIVQHYNNSQLYPAFGMFLSRYFFSFFRPVRSIVLGVCYTLP